MSNENIFLYFFKRIGLLVFIIVFFGVLHFIVAFLGWFAITYQTAFNILFTFIIFLVIGLFVYNYKKI